MPTIEETENNTEYDRHYINFNRCHHHGSNNRFCPKNAYRHVAHPIGREQSFIREADFRC